jgi:four helix bundle protein
MLDAGCGKTITIRNYRDLLVWQQAMRLAHLAYDCTNLFPSMERYVLLPQVRRAALSVPGNIAEGRGRAHTGDFLNFLSMSRGSLCELETYLIFANERLYLTDDPNGRRRSRKQDARALAWDIDHKSASRRSAMNDASRNPQPAPRIWSNRNSNLR